MSPATESDARRRGVLRRFARRWTASTDEHHGEELAREAEQLGVTHVRDVVPRTRVTVCGEVRHVTIRPRADVPALVAELWDGTAPLQLVWLGRREIAGIHPGVSLCATGMAAHNKGHLTIFNPTYEQRSCRPTNG